MKPLIFIFTFINSVICFSQSNDSIMFKPVLAPEREYKISNTTESTSSIEYSDNEEMKEMLKSKGLDHPIVTSTKMNMESTMKNGKLDKNLTFSTQTTFDKVSFEMNNPMLGSQAPKDPLKKLVGAIAFGQVDEKSHIKIDSIIGLDDEAMKNQMQQMMNTMFNQNIYPEKMLKKGESITAETPMTLPMGNGINIDMIIATHYSLDSISASLAHISLVQNTKMSTKLEQSDIKVNGLGEGKILYDTINKIAKLTYIDMVMTSDMKMDKFSMKVIANTKTTVKTEIVGSK